MKIYAFLSILGLALLASATCAKELDPTCALQLLRVAPDLLGATSEQNIGDVMRKAEAGEKDAQVTLSLLYPDGRLVPKDMGKAIEWATRAAAHGGAAEKEYLQYLSLLLRAESEPAEQLFRRGAEADVLYFQYAQAEFLRSTHPQEAMRWYEAAAAKGCMDARTKLSEMYGERAKPDLVRAHLWISLVDYASGFSGELKKYFEYDETRVRKAQAALRRRMSRSEIAQADELAARQAQRFGESYATRTWPDEAILYLTEQKLAGEIAVSRGYWLVHFSSFDENCAPCIESNTRLDELSRQLGAKVVFARITWEPWMEVGHETAQRYGIRGLPMMLLFKDGKECRRWSGGNAEAIGRELDRYCRE